MPLLPSLSPSEPATSRENNAALLPQKCKKETAARCAVRGSQRVSARCTTADAFVSPKTRTAAAALTSKAFPESQQMAAHATLSLSLSFARATDLSACARFICISSSSSAMFFLKVSSSRQPLARRDGARGGYYFFSLRFLMICVERGWVRIAWCLSADRERASRVASSRYMYVEVTEEWLCVWFRTKWGNFLIWEN